MRYRFAIAAALVGLSILLFAPPGRALSAAVDDGVAGADGTAGNGTLYIGAWPGHILILDEAAERVTGAIELKTGTAPRSIQLSHDRTRFYVVSTTMEDFEVVDVASRKSLDTYRLSQGRRRVRIRSLAPDPLHRFVVLLTKSAEKKVDHWVIGEPTLLVYDLKAREVTRTIPWPDGEAREFANILMSPDGKLLYFFSDDVLIYDTADFKQVDTWELSRPLEEGLGRIDFGPTDTTYEEPGVYTSLFRVTDPVQNRAMMGVARMDLAARRVDFYTIGPAEQVSFALAPDRKRAYGLRQEIGRYEFWTFDLEGRKLLKRTEFAGRPRMSLRPSSNGRVLYVFNAGNTIDLYDAATYEYLRTITLDADTTTTLYVVPGNGPPSQAR